MSQIRITRQRRTASAGRRERVEPELPLDLRDPDIVRAKQLRRPWLRKGITRVSATGFRGTGARTAPADGIPSRGVDWTAFVLSFKGVLLEGLEIALIVVSFGATAQAFPAAVLGAAAAFVVIAGAGLLARGIVGRIPRSALQLLVGTLLSSFGTFWAVEGLGVAWPGGDAAILALIGWYVVAAAGYIERLWRHADNLVPRTRGEP